MANGMRTGQAHLPLPPKKACQWKVPVTKQGEFQQEALDEKIVKQELERDRLAKAWGSKQQMARVSSAYEANVMTEHWQSVR